MKNLKRQLAPFVYILICGLFVKMVYHFIMNTFSTQILTIMIASSCFLFGMMLNKKRRKEKTYWLRIIAIGITILFSLIQMGFLDIPILKITFDFFAIDSFFIHMIYIYCGYLFSS